MRVHIRVLAKTVVDGNQNFRKKDHFRSEIELFWAIMAVMTVQKRSSKTDNFSIGMGIKRVLP